MGSFTRGHHLRLQNMLKIFLDLSKIQNNGTVSVKLIAFG